MSSYFKNSKVTETKLKTTINIIFAFVVLILALISFLLFNTLAFAETDNYGFRFSHFYSLRAFFFVHSCINALYIYCYITRDYPATHRNCELGKKAG